MTDAWRHSDTSVMANKSLFISEKNAPLAPRTHLVVNALDPKQSRSRRKYCADPFIFTLASEACLAVAVLMFSKDCVAHVR